MARSTTLAIRIVSDASGASKGFDDAASRTERFQQGLDKASVAAAGVLAGVGALAKAAFDSASALQQSSGAVEATFGAQAAQVQQLARQAANDAGLAQSEYGNLASVLGSQLRNMGVDAQSLVPQTQSLIGLGADLAAQFGGTTSEAVGALSSLLRGERDPIERYGVSMSQAAIDAQVAAMGLDTSTEAAKKNAQYQATLALLTQQTATAQGAFARESDTAAGAQQRASAQFENAKAALGDALLPIVADAAEKFAGLAQWVGENTTTVGILAGIIGGLAAAVLLVNGAITAYQTIVKVATALQAAWNFAMSLNPIGLIMIAIGLVIGAVVLMYNKFDWFRALVNGIGSFFGTVFSGIVNWIQSVWNKVGGLSGIFQSVFSFIGSVINAVLTPIKWLYDKLSAIIGFAGKVGSVVGGFFSAPAPAAGGGMVAAAGYYGSAGSAAPLRAASLSSLGAGVGGSLAGAQGSVGTVLNVTINGALDPIAVADQVQDLLTTRGVQLGQQRALAFGLGR